MVKQLRRKHLQVWITLAVLIPAGIVAAVVTRPKFATNKLLQADAPAALPVLIKNIDKEAYSANLRCNTDTSLLQLEWINKNTLTLPSALVYQLTSGDMLPGRDTILVGRVEATGTYRFSLKKAPPKNVNIILFDIIQHTQIDSLTF